MDDKITRGVRLSSAFSPAAPVGRQELFRGRLAQIMDCANALSQRGMHIAVYGERGVGKTSLANVLPEIVNNAGARLDSPLIGVRVDCTTTDDFAGLWHKVFREITGDPDYAVPRPLDSERVRYDLQRAQGARLIVLDELDRLGDNDALSMLADTLKALSDHAVPTTLMLVGVSRSLEGLLGEHQSVVRSIVQVPMPRMSQDELASVIDSGLATVPMTITDEAKTTIIQLAEGLPHYVHLLCLRAGEHAVEDDRTGIAPMDVSRAIQSLMRNHSIMSEYREATRSNQRATLYRHVLLACALASKNELGAFRAADLRTPLSAILGKAVDIPSFARHLDEMASDQRHNVLIKEGEARRYQYRFANPLLQPFVKMVSLEDGIIGRPLLDRLSSADTVPQMRTTSEWPL